MTPGQATASCTDQELHPLCIQEVGQRREEAGQEQGRDSARHPAHQLQQPVQEGGVQLHPASAWGAWPWATRRCTGGSRQGPAGRGRKSTPRT